MLKNYLNLIALFILISTVSVEAQNKQLNIVTTAVPFLRISTDARAGGMGDVGIATTPDANSIYWNQAKLPFAQSKAAIAASYTPWLRGLGVKDIYLTSLGGYYQLDETQALSASMKYFSLGNVQFTDENGNDLSSYRPNEFSFDAGYSRKLSSKLGLGIAVRYIHSKLASGNYNGQSYKPGSSVAADLSLFHDGTGGNPEASGLNWGIAITNLGSKISYTNDASRKDFIPANLGLGIAYIKSFNENTKATFGLDINKLLVPTPPQLSGNSTTADSIAINKYRNKSVLSSWFSSFGDAPGGSSEEFRELQISAGAEVIFQSQFALRTGYFYESPTKGNRKFFTVGGGLLLSAFNVNFSYLFPTGSGAQSSPLESTFRTSIIFNLNKQ
ncbi:MAG: type IX secretion system outer membrane channel protein PorV [Bacteroidota bacterium]|nr:type IX secretion system outer membrane channel protein PorV [Bacteroidota bacterium]